MTRAWQVSGAALLVRVRVTPNASREGFEGVWRDADARPYLAIRVRAVPEKGRANKAVVALLAKQLGAAKSSLKVVRGETDRLKTVGMDNGAHLADALEAEFGADHDGGAA